MTQTELLDRLEADLRQILETLRRDLMPLPDEALHHRTAQDRWTIAESCAHLNVFFERYIPRIEMAIHKAKARKWGSRAVPVSYAWFAETAIKRVHPDNTKKYRSKKKFDFYGQPLNRNALKVFIIHLERLLRTVGQARETDINRASLQRGGSGPFRFTLGNILEWLTLHSQRHAAQMKTLVPQI
jgi:uncharacterized damage-inducible protein DinB